MPASLYNEKQFVTLTSQYGICYEKQKFADNGIPVPTAFQDLTHPKLKRRVLISDITAGIELIKKVDPFTFYKRGSANVTHMEMGDTYASIAHAGWCVRMKKAGLNVTMSHPKINKDHTGAASYTLMIIVNGTKVAKAATAYLNEYIGEEYQFQSAKKTGVVPVNKHAIARMQDVPILQEMMILERAKMDRMLTFDFSNIDVSSWTDSWSRIIATN